MPATPPLTADFLSSLSPRRRHHKSWTNFQPLKEGLLNAKYGIGAGVFQLSAVSTWRNDGSEEFHFCLFSPSACYQRLFFFFFSLSLAADFRPFSCPLTSSSSVRSLSSGCCQRGRSRRGEGVASSLIHAFKRCTLDQTGARARRSHGRVRFQTARPPVSNAEDGGVAMKSPGILLAWEIESWSFCSRKTDRLAKRKMESKCPRVRECVGNGQWHRATSTCKAGPKQLGER